MLRVVLRRAMYRQYIFWRTLFNVSWPHTYSVWSQDVNMNTSRSLPKRILRPYPGYKALQPNDKIANVARSS